MPKLSIQIPHNLGREEATRRIKEQSAKAAQQVTGLEQQWQDHTATFRFKAIGFDVSGSLAVEDTAVKIDVDLPLAAAMFKGMIQERLRTDVAGLLK